MNFFLSALLWSTAAAFTVSSVDLRPKTFLQASSVGIYYSTSTGNTETCAVYIAEAAGLQIEDIGDAKDEEILGHNGMFRKRSYRYCKLLDVHFLTAGTTCVFGCSPVSHHCRGSNLAHWRRHAEVWHELG